MESLLEDDELGADREESVFEGLVRWMKTDGTGFRGEGLLRKIRYGAMNDEYLASKVQSAIPEHRLLNELLAETKARKGQGTENEKWDGVQRLCVKSTIARGIKGRSLGYYVLKEPQFVALDWKGRIVVSDRASHQIIIFNRDGSIARRLGYLGLDDTSTLLRPTGVAVHQQQYLVHADCLRNSIRVLNANGTIKISFGSEGTDSGQFNDPKGVAIDSEGHIVVADQGNHRIQVFDLNGSVVRHFGSWGLATGSLRNPTGVAIDGSDRIVVADRDNHRIQVFNGDGSVALCFGSKGNGLGQLKEPCGVAVDREGRFIVADTGNDRLQVFNSEGSAARIIDAAERGVGRMRSPVGVVVDETGRIVVAEGPGPRGNNHRIRVLWGGVSPGVCRHSAVPSSQAGQQDTDDFQHCLDPFGSAWGSLMFLLVTLLSIFSVLCVLLR